MKHCIDCIWYKNGKESINGLCFLFGFKRNAKTDICIDFRRKK